MHKLLLTAVLTAAVTAPLAAQNAAPAAAATPAAAQTQPGGTPEDRARGAVIMRSFSAAIQSDKVQPAVKNRLAACIYNNSLRSLSVATGNVFAKNTKLDPKNPQQIFAVSAQLCGVKPAESAQQGATPAPAPTPSTAAR